MSETFFDVDIAVSNIQIDNHQSKHMPVLFGASKLYKPMLQIGDENDLIKSYITIAAAQPSNPDQSVPKKDDEKTEALVSKL